MRLEYLPALLPGLGKSVNFGSYVGNVRKAPDPKIEGFRVL